jgi:hypothetical protein
LPHPAKISAIEITIAKYLLAFMPVSCCMYRMCLVEHPGFSLELSLLLVVFDFVVDQFDDFFEGVNR